jgi:hypothetical protein
LNILRLDLSVIDCDWFRPLCNNKTILKELTLNAAQP